MSPHDVESDTMGMIRIFEKSGKTKHKPGWQKAEADYQKWLADMQTMPSGFKSPKPGFRATMLITTKPQSATPRMLTDTCDGIHPVRSMTYVRGGGTKHVPRPEHVYADNPEMLARELAARERKFNLAPAYNKGPDQMCTEEELVALLSSNKRRS